MAPKEKKELNEMTMDVVLNESTSHFDVVQVRYNKDGNSTTTVVHTSPNLALAVNKMMETMREKAVALMRASKDLSLKKQKAASETKTETAKV